MTTNPEAKSADSYNRRGNVLREQGQLAEAIVCFRRGLTLMPRSPELLYNLGNALLEQRELAEAISCFQQVLAQQPDDAVTLSNLGFALREQGHLPEAIARFEQAARLSPDVAEIHANLGTALLEAGRPAEAGRCLQRALQLQPDDPVTLNSLALACWAQRQHAEAVGALQQAIALRPGYGEAYNNLGLILREQGDLLEAIACHRRALELKPDFAEAHNSLGSALWSQGELTEAMACYRRALQLKPDFVEAHSNLLYSLYFDPAYDVPTIYEEHRRWNERHAASLANSIRPYGNDRSLKRRLRVGYVSPNFRQHAEVFFIVPLLAANDHEQLEIYCYSDVALPDDLTDRIKDYAGVWRETMGLTDEQLSDLVRSDQIDILVDLTMHMANSRPLVFARKPAPVQVCWLAYQGTTGLSTIDYRLTDAHIDPPGLDNAYYSEESIRLPHAFWCYDPLTNGPEANPLPALARRQITFGSLNNFCKVNADVLNLWARVLQAVDRSRLMLLAAEGPHRQRTLNFLERMGIGAQRIEFVSFRPRSEYLALYHQIDIGLDTFPYNGQTTTLDAAWMGVPTLTIAGQTAVGRSGASLLSNLGLPEFIAHSAEEFVEAAVSLASDLPRLTRLRATLRQRLEHSPLMDAPRFARNVEAAYRDMWQRWCAK